MKIICVIPARGGSKGIPNKNLKIVGGFPLVIRSVLAASSSNLIDKTFVSSDSQEILELSTTYGASPYKREAVVSSDESSTEDVLLDFLENLRLEGIIPDILIYLQCTSPFTTGKDIDKVVNTLFENQEIDCVFSASEDHSFLWRIGNSGYAEGVNYNGYQQRQRRQDLVSVSYKENGAVYAIRVPALLKSKNRFGYKALPVTTENNCPFEIDNQYELNMARLIANMYPLPMSRLIYDGIKVLIMDFDGVHTNDLVFIDQSGVESIQVSRADGLGCGLLKNADFKLLILTKEKNPVVLQRAKKLGVEISHGVNNKLLYLKKWCIENSFKREQLSYIGNDINDLECLNWVGLPILTSDANPALLKKGFLTLQSEGGSGAIRELASIFLEDFEINL